MSAFAALPMTAAWRLEGAFDGFEVAGFAAGSGGWTITGRTVGVEGGKAWDVGYVVEVAADWVVRRGRFSYRGGATLEVAVDDARWTVDGVGRPDLTGCVDLDFELSAVTNTIPVHRLGLAPGERGESRAAFVRATGEVEILEQTYARVADDGGPAYDYAAPRFDYRDRLLFAADGLVTRYPGIATRVPTTMV